MNYAVIDVETSKLRHGEIPRTKFWGYADENGYKRFESSKNFARFLRGTAPKILLHHSNFDVIQLLVDGITDINILRSHASKLIRCEYSGHILQNTFTAFPVALSKIFKAFGFEKTSLKNLAKRNYEDCVNGLKCFQALDDTFIRLVGVSPLQCGTIAGTAFRAAEKEVGKMPTDLRFLSSYRGGRVEVFSTVKQLAHKYDIHSSYPASFLDCQDFDELWHVRVRTEDWTCPLFDASIQDILLFPNGEFNSYVFKSNWERYIEPNCVKTKLKILSRHKIDFWWLKKLNPLILKMYELKSKSKNDAIILAAKFLLNSFYGRIGLKGETERCRIMDTIPDNTDDVTYYSLAHGKWLCFDTVLRDTRSNYPYAAYITDNARARLYRAFARNRAIYGDTDSIFTTVPPAKFDGNKGRFCGSWAHEGKAIFKATNVKDYEFGDETIFKGGTEKDVWTLKQFAQGKTVEHVIRTRQTSLRKRRVLPDGNTMPLVVNH